LIKENDKVLVDSNVVPGKEIIVGVVRSVYETEDVNILVVELEEDKTLIKCLETSVTVLPNNDVPDVITISKDEFRQAVLSVTDLSSFECLGVLEGAVISVAGTLVCDRLEKELFRVKADND